MNFKELKRDIKDFMSKHRLSYRKLGAMMDYSGQNLHFRLRKDYSPDLDLLDKFTKVKEQFKDRETPTVNLDDLE